MIKIVTKKSSKWVDPDKPLKAQKYVVVSESTGRVMGRYPTMEKAKKRLQQVEMFKSLKKSGKLGKPKGRKKIKRGRVIKNMPKFTNKNTKKVKPTKAKTPSRRKRVASAESHARFARILLASISNRCERGANA